MEMAVAHLSKRTQPNASVQSKIFFRAKRAKNLTKRKGPTRRKERNKKCDKRPAVLKSAFFVLAALIGGSEVANDE